MLYYPTYSTTPTMLRNSRLRRDARTLEEEEEMWFDQEDEVEDGDTIVPMMPDAMKSKSKLDADFDQINKYFESKKGNYAEN